MSRQRGNSLQNALARYLAAWWPHAESAGAGRNGSDVLGTPGVVWECKTADEFKRDFRPQQWVNQARMHARAEVCGCTQIPELGPCDHILQGDVPVVVYFPRGIGEANTANALTIMPMHVLMHLLEAANYTPISQHTALEGA